MFNIQDPLANTEKFLNSLNMIFYAAVSLPLLLFCIFYLQLQEEGGLKGTTAESFQVMVHIFIPLLTLASLVLAWMYYRKQLRQTTTSFNEKLRLYYRISTRQYFLLFVASILPVAGLYLKGELLFAALYTLVLVASSFSRPTPRRIIKDLKLDQEEQNQLLYQH